MPIRGEILELNYPNYDPRKFFAIIKICKEYNIDIIHAHLHKPILGALLATFFCNVKVIVHEHGSVVRPGIQYTFYRFLLGLLRKRANLFIAVSNDMADELVSRIGVDRNSIKVVPNAVDLAQFNPEKTDAPKARGDLGVAPDDIVIGYVGRLHQVKGVDVLLKALVKLPGNYRLVLAGTGDQETALNSLARELGIEPRVKFMGFCKDVPALMAAFDIGVIPSRQESFGIVGIELMRMGVPVISTGVSGMADYMIDGDNALLVDVDSPDQIAECIQRIVSDKQLTQRLIEAGTKTAENFSVPRCVTAVEQIYKDVYTSR
jgi:glycosyltransferase involved in cell wall biosynthesis